MEFFKFFFNFFFIFFSVFHLLIQTITLLCSPYPTQQDRVADVTIFMAAGHDTTAYQLSWIIIELCRNPNVVVKLREELNFLFGDEPGGGPPLNCTSQNLNQLDYLSKIIKEGMRYISIVYNVNIFV